MIFKIQNVAISKCRNLLTICVEGHDPIIIHTAVAPKQDGGRTIHEVDYIEGFPNAVYCVWDLNKRELEIR